jgi:hypothetical protein
MPGDVYKPYSYHNINCIYAYVCACMCGRVCVGVYLPVCACVRGWGFTFSDLEGYSSRYNAESEQETMMVYGKMAVCATNS